MSAPLSLRRLFDAPYLLLCLTSLLWAGNFVVGRYVAGHVPPLSMALVRWVGATLIVLPFSYRQVMRDLPLIRAHFWSLLLLAATGISCFNAMSYYALQYTEALNGLLLQSMAPLLVGLWSFALFRDRLSLGQAAGVLTSLCGVLLIISRGEVDTLLHLKPNIGDVWILVALLIYAFYAAILRTRPPLGGLSFLTVIMAMGAVLLMPFGLWEAWSGRVLVFDTQSLLALLYVMIGPSLIAYLFFNRAVELVGANASAPFLHLMPVFGTGLAIAFLGERVAWFHLGGYALVISGIALATFAARNARKAGASEKPDQPS
ncbi:DMT family transporter [Xanthobacter variabilis]|uniref:DMT family transporter n=1 Tax=Xanthobacter variabilis TaxID=3119932 RepID=UPI00372842E5